jgi:hypothetical protein
VKIYSNDERKIINCTNVIYLQIIEEYMFKNKRKWENKFSQIIERVSNYVTKNDACKYSNDGHSSVTMKFLNVRLC